MKGLAKKNTLIASISERLKSIGRNGAAVTQTGGLNKKSINQIRDKLDEWIKEGKFLENYSTDEILDEFGITRKELSFYCSSILKKKFVSWRKELRVKEAQRLLVENPDTPACHIGFAAGFSDKSNFRQQFKSVVGCTPTEWRERYLNGHKEKN